MKLIERIEKLEAKAEKPAPWRTLWWNDDDEDELETLIARDRKSTGFDGKYQIFVGVSGHWVDGHNGTMRWVRPPRAAKRYVHAEPTLDIPAEERNLRIGSGIGGSA